MPTTQIRQAAVGMRGVHLANSCAQTAKIARSIREIRLHNSDHWLGTADSLLRCNLGLESCPQRLFWATPNIARSGQLRPRSCRTRAGLDGRWNRCADGRPNPTSPKRILPTKLLPISR